MGKSIKFLSKRDGFPCSHMYEKIICPSYQLSFSLHQIMYVTCTSIQWPSHLSTHIVIRAKICKNKKTDQHATVCMEREDFASLHAFHISWPDPLIYSFNNFFKFFNIFQVFLWYLQLWICKTRFMTLLKKSYIDKI